MDGRYKSLKGFYKLGEEMCTFGTPIGTHTSPFFAYASLHI